MNPKCPKCGAAMGLTCKVGTQILLWRCYRHTRCDGTLPDERPATVRNDEPEPADEAEFTADDWRGAQAKHTERYEAEDARGRGY